MAREETCSGAGVGGIIAAIISWKLFHSVGWTILHFFFSWAYVFYACYYYWSQIKLWFK